MGVINGKIEKFMVGLMALAAVFSVIAVTAMIASPSSVTNVSQGSQIIHYSEETQNTEIALADSVD
jgi:hypothetical protein